ncbi:hypothetical protein G9A89_006099 [Geosiphon pyriformis]|nr:hypothetical protein G9A89_006099 [Geosiphon pyriformis]
MEDPSSHISSLKTIKIERNHLVEANLGSLDPNLPSDSWQRRNSTGAACHQGDSSVPSSGDEEKARPINDTLNSSTAAAKKKKGLRLSLSLKSFKSPLPSLQSVIPRAAEGFWELGSTTLEQDRSSSFYSKSNYHKNKVHSNLDPQTNFVSSSQNINSSTSSNSFFSFFNHINHEQRSSVSSIPSSSSSSSSEQRQKQKITHQRSNTSHSFDVKETHTINKEYDPMTGNKMINKYMLIKEIGRGVHGKVKLGRDMETGELVAIKIVDRTSRRRLGQRQNEPSNEQKIRKEIAILKKCVHPHVVGLKEVIDDPMSKKIYIVLEFMEGGEIRWKDNNDRPVLNLDQARKIFRDVVLGLEYLHHQGIIHRDIKPANLLITADKVVKISDFGVSHLSQRVATAQVPGNNGNQSRLTGNDTELSRTAGSPAFFAPELCFTGDVSMDFTSSSGLSTLPNEEQFQLSMRGISSNDFFKAQRPPITKAIDVWALGVTLYCFIFGRCPFIADTEFELFFNIIPRMPLEFPEGIPIENALKDLLVRLLEKDPSKRVTLEEVKKHPWVVADLPNPEKWREETDPNKYHFVTVSDEEMKSAYTVIDLLRKKFRKLSVSLGNLTLAGLRRRSKSVSSPSMHSEDDFAYSPSSTLDSSPIPIHSPKNHLLGVNHQRQQSLYGTSLPEASVRRMSKDVGNFASDSDEGPSLSSSSSSSRSTIAISATSLQPSTPDRLEHHQSIRPSSRNLASKSKSNNSHSSLNQTWVANVEEDQEEEISYILTDKHHHKYKDEKTLHPIYDKNYAIQSHNIGEDSRSTRNVLQVHALNHNQGSFPRHVVVPSTDLDNGMEILDTLDSEEEDARAFLTANAPRAWGNNTGSESKS